MAFGRITLREALASNRLEDFVRQEEARGAELVHGSNLERALALLITQRRSENRSSFRSQFGLRGRRTPQCPGGLAHPRVSDDA